jgi:hypothetical protein
VVAALEDSEARCQDALARVAEAHAAEQARRAAPCAGAARRATAGNPSMADRGLITPCAPRPPSHHPPQGLPPSISPVDSSGCVTARSTFSRAGSWAGPQAWPPVSQSPVVAHPLEGLPEADSSDGGASLAGAHGARGGGGGGVGGGGGGDGGGWFGWMAPGQAQHAQHAQLAQQAPPEGRPMGPGVKQWLRELFDL